MKLNKIIPSLLIGLTCLFNTASVAYADVPSLDEEVTVVETVHTLLYMNGGIGKDEVAYMRKNSKEFSLRMEFTSHKDNEFIADVKLVIEDDLGHPVFMLPAAGPMTNVMLPPGKYRILANYRGLTEIHNITVSDKNGIDVLFNWKGHKRP